jgi:hypothetical protein
MTVACALSASISTASLAVDPSGSGFPMFFGVLIPVSDPLFHQQFNTLQHGDQFEHQTALQRVTQGKAGDRN